MAILLIISIVINIIFFLALRGAIKEDKEKDGKIEHLQRQLDEYQGRE